ncbi:MAG: hypothetical protein KIS96_08860 [Bauldia sp.]|nr:hypothetical protein [Bauldia sp.]
MYELLVFIHLVGLAVGIGVPIGNLAIQRIAASAPPEVAAVLRSIPGRLAWYSRGGLIALVVSGLLMQAFAQGRAMVSFGGVWFWLKMVAVVGLIAAVYFIWQTMEEARKGNPAVMARMRMLGPAVLGLSLLATLFAVIAFH